MGIPSYFSYLVRNHPSILRRITQRTCANLYLDCNSLVYDAVHNIDFSTLQENEADTILRMVCAKIDEHIRLLGPQQNVFIAFDGVAPVAKLEQQRSRRFKSMYQQRMLPKTNGKGDPFNTAAITPGTVFMQKLNETMYQYFADPTTYGLQRLIVSGSDQYGEGEHKLFAYMRDFPEQHAEGKGDTIIYGLDADLIMLSLNHLPVCSRLYLYRETPHFIQSINVELEPSQSYLLDIPALAAAIVGVLTPANDTLSPSNRLHDYIFLCFLLGNDFLPHFPAINIRTGGVDKLMQAYQATMDARSALTQDGQGIHWVHLRKFVAYLAQQEERWLREEKKTRDRVASRLPFTDNPEERLMRLPMVQRETEHFINPFQPGWQNRYYRSLFGMIELDEQRRQQICTNYLQGLEWTMRYYTQGCCDYRWKYRYMYPPLLEDLIRCVPFFDMTHFPEGDVVSKKPIPEMVQLCYVLPKQSLHLLPEKVRASLDESWHREDCDFVWAFCKYFWESHVDLPEIELDLLEASILRSMEESSP